MLKDLYQQEHRIFRESIRRFVADRVTPNVDQWEEAGAVPRDLWLAMGEQGFCAPGCPSSTAAWAWGSSTRSSSTRS